MTRRRRRMTRRQWFARLWLLWAVGGLVSAVIIEGVDLWGHWQRGADGAPGWVWIIWAVIGALLGGALEVYAIAHRELGDTLSEQIWSIEGGGRSFVVMLTLVGAWVVATGQFWPAFGIAFFGWAAWHFTFEKPDEDSD